jgi:hypothetical protein
MQQDLAGYQNQARDLELEGKKLDNEARKLEIEAQKKKNDQSLDIQKKKDELDIDGKKSDNKLKKLENTKNKVDIALKMKWTVVGIAVFLLGWKWVASGPLGNFVKGKPGLKDLPPIGGDSTGVTPPKPIIKKGAADNL